MGSNPIILFDGECNLCNGSVQYVIKKDKDMLFRFASLQSSVGQAMLKQYNLPNYNFNSFVLIDNDKIYTKSTAALEVAKRLDGFVKGLYIFIIVPKFIRDFVYRLIAKNRYKWFGKSETCMTPTAELKNLFLQ